MRDRTTVVVLVALLVLQGCATVSLESGRQDDLPKFLMVDEHVYRGGQPTAEGVRQLAKLGIKTVVDLRAENVRQRQEEQQLVESLGMRWVHLPIQPYWRPSDEQVLAFLDVVLDQHQQPVFVHCHAGKNRAGMMVAIYRIAAQEWHPEEAFREALALGLAGWSPLSRALILSEAERAYRPYIASVRSGTDAWPVQGIVPVRVFARDLLHPAGVVVDAQSNLYVTSELRDGAVIRITPAGDRAVVLRGLVRPDELAMDETGTLYVSEERAGGHIYRVSQDSPPLRVASSLRNPDGLTFDAQGHLYVAEDVPDGRVLRVGQGVMDIWVDQLERPEGIVFDEEGILYVSETTKHQITRIRPNGQRDVLVARPWLYDPDGLTYCAPYRGIFVTEDQPRGRLRYVALTGHVITLAENLQHPDGIACDADGNLYVAERGRGRILKLFAEHLQRTLSGHRVTNRGRSPVSFNLAVASAP